ncbi:hypothetical protein GCM10010340_57670 [Streptomyces griseoloalbus]|nr:hypothetical protein GCM10010340_57670 [Streptomyces albaduncus]
MWSAWRFWSLLQRGSELRLSGAEDLGATGVRIGAVPADPPDDGTFSSTADAAAAWTGSTVAVVNLHAITWQAEVSRSPRPRLWR